MRFRFLIALLCAACALAAVARAASAAPPLVVPDTREPAPIRIIDSSTHVLDPNGVGDMIDIVCFAFVNDGPRTAVSAAFDLTFGRNGSTFMYRAGKGVPQTAIGTILVTPRELDYDDGTAWHASLPPRTAGSVVDLAPPVRPALAVPNGPPLLTWRNPPDTQLRIDDAYLNERGRWLYACISFTNLAPSVARRIRADMTLLDREGTVVNVDRITVAGRIKPNDPLKDQNGSCQSVNGRYDADTYLYSARGDVVPLGRIIISPAAIEFDDGTTWTEPAPAAIGAPVSAALSRSDAGRARGVI